MATGSGKWYCRAATQRTPLAKMYSAWRGKDPSVEPMMKYRGLRESGSPGSKTAALQGPTNRHAPHVVSAPAGRFARGITTQLLDLVHPPRLARRSLPISHEMSFPVRWVSGVSLLAVRPAIARGHTWSYPACPWLPPTLYTPSRTHPRRAPSATTWRALYY